jgi:dextranase
MNQMLEWGPELLPAKAAFSPGDAVVVEVRGLPATATVSLWRLGECVRAVPVADGRVDFGPLPEGGYGVELAAGGSVLARTALAVGGADMRYGFVADYRPGRDATGVAEFARRLHLTDVQFYDWAYRHADLLGGGETYGDALGQPVSLDTVRGLIAALAEAGVRALGYAAVYGVGNGELDQWDDLALLRADGEPWTLGDFLTIVDPGAPRWLEHFVADLAAAQASVGFAGWHLDQYGYPKQALRRDGVRVDLAAAFGELIATVRGELGQRPRLVFNQVNDFPTWSTGESDQDAVYVEVWPPHTGLADLGRLTTAARTHGRPTVISAYLHCYETAEVASADRAAALTMAAIFSHGGTHLLAGEAGRLLSDPYYVRNQPLAPTTAQLLRRWYDFLVENGDYLTDPAIVEVTGAYAGDYNGDLDVRYPTAQVRWDACPGTVWRRVTRRGDDLVVHLINLTGQSDLTWDAPKEPLAAVAGGVLRFRPATAAGCRVQVGDPDGAGRLVDVPTRMIGGNVEAELPALQAWQLIVVKDADER